MIKRRMKLIFGTWLSTKVFHKLMLPYLVDVVKHAQMAYLIVELLEWKYLKIELMDCLDSYMFKDHHQSFFIIFFLHELNEARSIYWVIFCDLHVDTFTELSASFENLL